MSRPIAGKHTLKYPILLKDGTTEVSEIVIVRPQGADRLIIDNYLTPEGGIVRPMAMQLEMIERLCRKPDGTEIFAGFSRVLDDEDVDALGEFVMPDLPSGRATGGTP